MKRDNSIVSMPTDLRTTNREMILKAFRNGEERTLTEVSELIGASRQTVTKAIWHFENLGILEAIGKGESTSVGGRKPAQYRLSPTVELVMINIEYDAVIFTLFNLLSQVLEVFCEPLETGDTYQQIWDAVERGVVRLKEMADEDKIKCVGLSIRGLINTEKGILRYSTYYSNWNRDENIRTRLETLFPKTKDFLLDKPVRIFSKLIYVENEEKLKDKHTLVLYSQHGIAAGLIDQGTILNGANSLIGEIGHMIIDKNYGRQCACGNFGCFEQLYSLEHMRELIQADGGDSPLKVQENVTYEDIFKASAQGDRLGRKLSLYMADQLSVVLRNLYVTFDPEILYFLGNFAFADDAFIDRLSKTINTFRYLPQEFDIEIVKDPRSINELLQKGSIVKVIDHFYSNPGLYE